MGCLSHCSQLQHTASSLEIWSVLSTPDLTIAPRGREVPDHEVSRSSGAAFQAFNTWSRQWSLLHMP